MLRYFYFFLVVGIMSCQSSGTSIKGTISDAPNLSVFLDQVDPVEGTNSILVRSETNGSGNFSLSTETPLSAGIYRVRVGANSAYLIINGSEKNINVSGQLNDLSNFSYSVSGSPLSASLVDNIGAYAKGEKSVQDLSQYVQNEADPLLGLMVATQMFGGTDEFYDLHKNVAKRLVSQYPDYEHSTRYDNFAGEVEKAYLRRMSLEKVRVGEMTPDIELPGLNGKTKKLSELKGNVVLLDFWASWCGPCRKENPNVVRVYDKYAPKGFTVFSVSLDGLDDNTRRRYPESQLDDLLRSQKERWLAAIKQDNLKWDNHVSDLKKWNSAGAATYGVSSIPRTFLIDRDGKIAAINPRGNLEQAVQSLM